MIRRLRDFSYNVYDRAGLYDICQLVTAIVDIFSKGPHYLILLVFIHTETGPHSRIRRGILILAVVFPHRGEVDALNT